MELYELIERLTAAHGPAGRETAAASAAAGLLWPLCDRVWSDSMGSVIGCRLCGREDAPRLLIDAHLDEVGLVVTGREKGFLRLSNLGGVDARMLPARDVLILSDPPIPGVIDTMPVHVLSAEEMDRTVKKEKLFINAGLTEEEAEQIPLGTPVVFPSPCTRMGEHRLSAKALDDRACAAIILRALELTKNDPIGMDLYVLFAVQEELGLRGAQPGAFGISPDAAIALDVTHAATPDAHDPGLTELGKGVAIGVGPNMDRTLTGELFALAEAEGISCQTEVIPGRSGTDAWVIQTTRAGVPTALMSLPLRYMHTPVETMDLRDAEAAARLLAAAIRLTGKEEPDA